MDELTFAGAVASISVIKPWIMSIIKSLLTYKISSIELRKSTNLLIAYVLGIAIAISVNHLGEFAMPLLNVIIIGLPVSAATSQFIDRTKDHIENTKKGK